MLKFRSPPIRKATKIVNARVFPGCSVSPPDSYVETLTPNVIVSGDEAFEKRLGHRGGAFMMALLA